MKVFGSAKYSSILIINKKRQVSRPVTLVATTLNKAGQLPIQRDHVSRSQLACRDIAEGSRVQIQHFLSPLSVVGVYMIVTSYRTFAESTVLVGCYYMFEIF